MSNKTLWLASAYIDGFDQLHISVTNGSEALSVVVHSIIFINNKVSFHAIIDKSFDPVLDEAEGLCDYIFQLSYLATNTTAEDWAFDPNLEQPYEDSGIWHVKFAGKPEELLLPEPAELAEELPGIHEEVKNPVTGIQQLLFNAIMDLNDTQEWSRDAIADWLETLDIDTRFRLEDKDEQD